MRPIPVLKIWAKKRTHFLDEFQDTFVGDFIENKIGIFAVIDDPLTSQNIQVLGNISVGCFNLIADLTNRKFFVLE